MLVFIIVALVLVSIRPYSSSAEENEQIANTEANEQAVTTETETQETTEQTDIQVISIETGELFPITATKKVAENNLLDLYVDDQTGNIRVVNKKSNKEWLGSPQVDTSTLANNKSFIDSPVHIEYTDGSSVSQTYTLKDPENAVNITNIEEGIRAEFDVSELKISFAVEYRLTDDGFEVTIPESFIKETGTVRITSLEVLPFLNAAKEADDGALFIPDGSGALMTYKKQHPQYFSGYSEPVYGPDHAFASDLGEVLADGWKRAAPPKEHIALPVFGNYKNENGYIGIITHGEENAYINATPSGIRNISLYRAGVEFIYRKQDVMFIGSSGRIPLFQGNRIEGDRKVKYILLEDEKANYVGMAQAYREYLKSTVGLKTEEQNSIPLHVELFGGLLRDEIIGSTFIEMTTFEQVRSIIDDYVQKGITDLEITLNGWSKDGLYGNQPEHFPVEKQLGGKKELESLINYAKDNGVALHLKTNYVRPFQESDGFKQRSEAIRGIDREVTESPNYYISSRFSNNNQLFYLLKPEQVYKKVEKEVTEYKNLGVAGVHVSNMGNLLYSDQDTDHFFTRKQTAETWVKTLDKFRDEVGVTSVDYGFAYTFGHIDKIINIPIDSSHFVYMDQTVPFYQIAIHGLIPYTAKPTNLRNDARFELLRAIEYGALPSFELTYESTSNLRRTMEDRLFSSDYRYWADKSIEEYERFQEIYQTIYNQPIVNHEQIDRNVFKTTYENGTQIIVNYNNKTTTVNGQIIDGYDYAVIEGEGK